MRTIGRRPLLLGGAALLWGVLAGCSAAGMPQPGASTGGPGSSTGAGAAPRGGAAAAEGARAASQAELADLAVRLNAAVAAGDPTGFAAVFAPGLATDAAVLFDNARVLGAWRAEPGHEVLWLRSRAAAEQGWGSAAVVPALDADGRVAALPDRPGDLPVVWLRRPVEVVSDGRVAVIAARGASAWARRWCDAAADAAARLATVDLAPWRPDRWDGSLTLELPADLLQFGQDAGTAAYVRLRRPDDAPRIVANPAAAGRDDQLRAETMAHEAVHAITRSPGRAAPAWAIEGFAERWAERVHPALERRNRDRVRASTATGLPTDADLRAGVPDAYPRAALAVAAAQRRWGEERVAAWIADWAGSDPPPPDAFAAELSAARDRW